MPTDFNIFIGPASQTTRQDNIDMP